MLFADFSFLLPISINSVLGVIAIVISWLTYNSQKPNLSVKVKYCNHHYQKSEVFAPEMEIRFSSILEIKNRGDRGTTLNKIELSYVDNGKKCILEDSTCGKQTEGTDCWGNKITQVEFRWINPSETIGVGPVLVDEFHGVQKEEIDCIFTVFSTRKNYKVKFTSKKC
jgi:hypothetical protein